MKFQITVPIISLCLLNSYTRSHNDVTHPNFKSFHPGDVINALSRVSHLDLGGSSAASTDEE
jgi:hypothetical protein